MKHGADVFCDLVRAQLLAYKLAWIANNCKDSPEVRALYTHPSSLRRVRTYHPETPSHD